MDGGNFKTRLNNLYETQNPFLQINTANSFLLFSPQYATTVSVWSYLPVKVTGTEPGAFKNHKEKG